ncbi:MAG: type I secretion system permease/ATPase [Geminicoccaceae bacterium]|nr:type I secretion system permease/ATPase [Geminicoccaceae bacterium]
MRRPDGHAAQDWSYRRMADTTTAAHPASPGGTLAREADRIGDRRTAGTGDVEPIGDGTSGWQIRQAHKAALDPLLSALEILAQLLDHPTSADAMRAGLPLEDGLLTPALVERAAARAGLSARLVRCPLDDIHETSLPCILLLDERRACVLIGKDARGDLQVVLPEAGRGVSVLARDEIAPLYAGFAVFARPELAYEQRARELQAESGRHWFWSTLFTQWPVYGEVLIAAVVINLFALASPLFVMNVYDRVVPNNAIDTLWVLALGVTIVFAFDFLLKTLRGYFIDAAGRVTDVRLASSIFHQVLGIKMTARPPSAGAFANNLREFESLREFFTSATVTTLVDLPFVVFFIAIVWYIGGPVAVVPAVAVPLVLIVGLLLQLPLNRIVKRTVRESAQKHGVLVEAINGLETIKSIGAEGRIQRAWEGFVAATAKSGNQARLLSSITVNFAALATNLVTVGVIIVGVHQIGEGLMTVGALIAATIISGRAMAPLGQVAGLLTRLHQARTSYQTLDKLMDLEVERPAGRRFVDRRDFKGAIEFKNVSLSYPNQKLPALADVSFRIQPGERVALIGRIGSGKTTIEKLILGLYEPQTGAVLVDGTDVRQIDPADLRRNIGCVPQDVFLFQGTIRENITMGAPLADDGALLRAASVAGVEQFVARHPSGYDMPVGERGEQLSGGQRQAIAVARALLLDPPILILDEPTSAMDNGSEARLKNRLSAELDGRTLVLVTHRASLLSLVDRVIILDNGALVADGPRDKVLQALAAGQLKGSG